jgi:UDP-glucuronate 4-epimerase
LDIAVSGADALQKAVGNGVDAIIHMAARAGVRPSIENPEAYQHTNVIGLQHILEFARLEHISQFVFASSSSVYGVNDHFPWRENEQLMPISPYAMTKQAGEMLGHVYSKLYGIRFLALRFFTVYGPSQRPDLAIHKFTKNIIADQPITLYGNGDTSRDYTYVDDVVNGVIQALHYDQSAFEIINLGNHFAVPLHELVSRLEKIIGKTAMIQRMPEQPGDVKSTFADITKAHRLLNYSPATPLDEGLQNFVGWYIAMQKDTGLK